MAKKAQKDIQLNEDTEETKINNAVNEINQMIGDSYFSTAIKVGDYIFNYFFDNDPKKVKSKDPNKRNSFNKLCQRSELKVHPKHLYQMVVIAVQEKLLLNGIIKTNKSIAGIEKDKLDKLNYSIKVELLKVASEKNKLKYANHFIDNNFTVMQAREYIKSKLGIQTTLDIVPFNKSWIDQFSEIIKWSESDGIDGDFSKLSNRQIATIKKQITGYSDIIKNISDIKEKFDNKITSVQTKLQEREAELNKQNGTTNNTDSNNGDK